MSTRAQRLANDELNVEGRLVDASNATLLCIVDGRRCVYKPIVGERPLWDFPNGTLAGRELAAYEVDRLLGWGFIPLTVWRQDGPAGAGMAQDWCEDTVLGELVTVTQVEQVPPGWRVIVEALDPSGRPVALAHADSPELQRLCVLDAVINNGDRKGGHILTGPDGTVWAVDHGVAFHRENKLRTVLWGWAGEMIPDPIVADLDALRAALADSHPIVDTWLAPEESTALRGRVDALVATRRFPAPSEEWPAIPWPVF